MNRWARALWQAPATLQRLIARHNRISLPRGCSADERLARLRAALIHQRTVRVTYFSLDAATQAALQELRRRQHGIRTDDLVRRYGPIRPLTALAADPQPQTISERLLLLGWLLPRQAPTFGSAGFLLVPDVRAWLPVPLALPTFGSAAPPPLVPALHATTVLLLAASERPLAVRADGLLRQASLRRLQPRLSPLVAPDAAALYAWLLPLLSQLDLLECRAGHIHPTVAASRFLSRPLGEQQQRLEQTWIGLPQPDAWLCRLLTRDPLARRIDWPVLRRRLLSWAATLPAGQWVAADGLHDALAAALGPLADAQTHGLRPVDRVPWQPRRAAAIWDAALHGPLAWLGLVTWDAAHPPRVARVAGLDQVIPPELPGTAILPTEADAAGAAPAAPPAWQYGHPGALRIPHTSNPAAILRLLPFADWCATDATHSTYQVTTGTLARAASQGWSDTVLWQLLTQQAGPPPAGWRGSLDAPPRRLRLIQTAVLVADAPAVLTRAAQSRSVRRALDTQLAPGIALVQPAQVPALRRALARQDLVLAPLTDHAAPPPAVPGDAPLSAAACAALLLACACYRQFAPPDAPYVPPSDLEERLRAGLTPALRQAVTVALTDLPDPAGPTATQVAERLREAAVQVQRADAQRATAERRAREWERRARQAEARLQAVAPAPPPPARVPADDFWAELADVLGTRPAADAAATAPTPLAYRPPATDDQPVPAATRPAPADHAAPATDHQPPAAVPIVPGSRVHVQFDQGITVVTAPDGTVTTHPLDAPAEWSDGNAWDGAYAPPGARVPGDGPAPAAAAPAPIGTMEDGGDAEPDSGAIGPPAPAAAVPPADPPPAPDTPAAAPPGPAPGPPADPIPLLRRAIARRRTLEVAYDTGGRGQLDTRLLRPLALEAHGPVWYLRAYCPRRHAERTFRVDRLQAFTVVGGRGRRGDPEARRWQADRAAVRAVYPEPIPMRVPPQRRATPSGVPPLPEPGKPRIWLVEG
jgi:hypothetical protein